MKLDKTNITRLFALITFLFCFSMIWWADADVKKVLILSVLMICWFYLGFKSRRPHPKEKPFSHLFVFLHLKVRIFISKMELKRHPDLRHYRTNEAAKNYIKIMRLELKELKAELKALVK